MSQFVEDLIPKKLINYISTNNISENKVTQTENQIDMFDFDYHDKQSE